MRGYQQQNMGVVILQIQMYRHYCHAITLRGYKYRKTKTHKKEKKKTQVSRQLNKKSKNSLSLIIF